MTPSADSEETAPCHPCGSAESPHATCSRNGESLPGNEIWSKAAALRSVGGDRALLCELIESFLVERPKLMANLELAVETSDPDRLQFAAHVLKGSMRCFHAPEAMQPAEELETRGRMRDLSEVAAPYAQLCGAVDRLSEALSAFVSQEIKVKPK
jgi:HPt (histidine-containing phosphotransfer) domain-containing protein